MTGSAAGFRRRIRINPAATAVQAELEDDYHCMSVVLRHHEDVVRDVEVDMRRVPWTTCPGAADKLKQDLRGKKLGELASNQGKQQHCTHLFDLSQWAAGHAHDAQAIVFDIAVSDPVDGTSDASLDKNGETVMRWQVRGFDFVAPAALKDFGLFSMKPWIATLSEQQQEYARILQWGTILSHGRTQPLENQSDASRMPPNCYTFQPERAAVAKRVGEIRDFSSLSEQPLDRYPPLLAQ